MKRDGQYACEIGVEQKVEARQGKKEGKREGRKGDRENTSKDRVTALNISIEKE